MSGDEILVLFACVALLVFFWYPWVRELSSIPQRGEGDGRAWLVRAPVVSLCLLVAVLLNLAASDVRDDPVYLFFYLLMGASWMGAGAHVLSYFGLDARDDVLERGNPAAGVALGGALLGITLCFAGGNIGNGPGWWVVVVCAALATGTLFLLWTLLAHLGRAADSITIDRDVACGWRIAGFFAGAGLILGRAVAGDWEGIEPTLRDFVRYGWPVLVLFLVAVLLERRLRPSAEAPERPVAAYGAAPALLYLALGALAVYQAGPWS